MDSDTLMRNDALSFAGLEFATFRLKAGVTEASLLAASARVDREFLAGQEGLLGHVLLKGSGGLYADMALADSQQRAEQICALWTGNAVALGYIELLDPQSVSMTFWQRLR